MPPNPAALIESLRAFGYSLPTAVADLIDNSITAEARRIDVRFSWKRAASSLMIRDDGHGMDEPTLVEAMRLGTRSPTERRAEKDLGRFGLGLKTAGWSQARSLTVVTRREGSPVLVRRWDLDHVRDTGRWLLQADGGELAEEEAARLSGLDSGTTVILERLDRLAPSDANADDPEAETRFRAAARDTAAALGVVFHRFLAGRDAIVIHVDGNHVEPWDPFLAEHAATQALSTESFTLEGHRIEVAPFVLPHSSKLTDAEHERAAGLGGWNAQQGFYVYRARRLLVGGGWLGIARMQQEEHYKLARIRVDLDNALDGAWQIDVRKATARIPGSLARDLERIARATRSRASEVYRFRGKAVARSTDTAVRFVWTQRTVRGGIDFRVNRNHPAVRGLLREGPAAVERTLRLVEENLPVEAIVIAEREQPRRGVRTPYEGRSGDVLALLRTTHAAVLTRIDNPRVALNALADVEPFSSHPEVVQLYREELGL